jgi:predicted Zn finger-like uncharacterized protein
MLIACPNCATSYQVDAYSIGVKGRSVRCVRCKTVWFALPPGDPAYVVPQTADADAGEVSAFRSELGADAAPPEPTAVGSPAETDAAETAIE